jgi:hypothetical protein
VVLALVPPTSTAAEYTLWLGEFDALGTPRHNGTAPAKGGKEAAVTADWIFFPHPVYRQGLLVVPPPKSALRPSPAALNVRLRAGQEVVLRFATAEELPGLVKE